MYENYENNERKTIPNNDYEYFQPKHTKSLISLNTNNSMNKNLKTDIIKNPLPKEQYSKTNRIYFSTKKAKDYGYILTNPVSNSNKDNFILGGFNLYKYKSKDVLNNINKNQQTNINLKYGLSNYDIIKKSNYYSNNNNNSLVNSSDNIAITLTNNKYNDNKFILNSFGFNRLSGIKIGSNNKSLYNSNEVSAFHSRNKFKEKSIQMNKNKKENKNQYNSNRKKITSFKTKSKPKIKSQNNYYSTTNSNLNDKTRTKSFVNNIISINNTNNEKISENMDNRNEYNNEKAYLYNNINDNEIYFNESKKIKGNDLINVIYINNLNNKNILNNDLDVHLMNTFSKNNNRVNDAINSDKINSSEDLSNIENMNKIGYQTYNGPFRKKIIKVNTLDKDLNQNYETQSKLSNCIQSSKSLNSSKVKINTNIHNNNLLSSYNDLQSEKIFRTNYNEGEVKIRNHSNAYVKKKTLFTNVNNNEKDEKKNFFGNTYRNPIIKHTKNNSVSGNIYINKSNKKENKVNIIKENIGIYSPKNNKTKNLFNGAFYDYERKLENIKSRVSDLLNIYSFLALRTLGTSNDKN